MLSSALILALALASVSAAPSEFAYSDLAAPAHQYYSRELQDPFTRLKADLEAGLVPLDRTSEKAFLLSLLRALDIPSSSQMLVFSTTSLQLSLITPSNPRALYFNEELYLGYIPGGKIEIISTDPELGAIFYIFDIPKNSGPLSIERSRRCMNCHAAPETGEIPGLLIKSVVPGPRGGTLDAFRQDRMGHDVPLEDRFGGWYLTRHGAFTNHYANFIGRLSPEGLSRRYLTPGEQFDFTKYPFSSSDLLPQLLHEHQAGFVNTVLEATYRVRAALHLGGGTLTRSHEQELQALAATIVRYLLFAGEASLPEGGIEADPQFIMDFRRNARQTAHGSLKDFDLKTRLFRHRCSYMIYSGLFRGMPAPLYQAVLAKLEEALDPARPNPQFAFLPAPEKHAIRSILRETLPNLPAHW